MGEKGKAIGRNEENQLPFHPVLKYLNNIQPSLFIALLKQTPLLLAQIFPSKIP